VRKALPPVLFAQILIESHPMQPISATVITYNEEHNIREALQSISWVNEIIVVDSGSSDDTVAICRGFTDKIFHREWTGYVDQKNYAVDRAGNDWILSLDADERSSPELCGEVRELARAGFRCPGYRIPRVTFFMGRWIRHGDWYPDYQLRLFDRRHGKWEGGRVHESVKMKESPSFLKGEIQHFTYRNFSDYLRRLELYSNLAALDYCQRGKSATALSLLGNPIGAFVKSYLVKRGFLDGTPGFAVAAMGAVSVFFKYAKLYELQGKSGSPGPGVENPPS
jgi:glycosyltransferase involved in cell wall biosynthesis